MHYNWSTILNATKDLGDSYRKAVITLDKGDTAHSPLSTKWIFAGPGDVEYLIHPACCTVRPDDTVTKRYT